MEEGSREKSQRENPREIITTEEQCERHKVPGFGIGGREPLAKDRGEPLEAGQSNKTDFPQKPPERSATLPTL